MTNYKFKPASVFSETEVGHGEALLLESLLGAKHTEKGRPALRAVEKSNMGATFLQKDVTS